jgi:uncharacterized protein (TIGR03118 family)
MNRCSHSVVQHTRHVYRTTLRLHASSFVVALALSLGSSLSLSAANGPPQHYQQKNLVSDIPGLAAATDAHLVNPWGLARSATSPWWVADNGTGVSTVYNGAGAIQPLVVTVPNAPGVAAPSAPTGIVFNGSTTEFLLPSGQAARFLFATEEGTISGWSSGTTAVLVVNNAGKAVYKGLAIAQSGGASFLYAANFQTRTVDVFNKSFQPVTLAAGAFRDPTIPASYAPFNVQAIGGSIYVMFAQTEEGSIEEVEGPGKGYVAVFSPQGELQKRLQWGAWFNAPWGVALAPADFGGFSHMILVGQFGSGKIAAFDPVSGEFRGLMRGAHGMPLSIEGLWALGFGNGGNAGPATTLFFTAGIDDEAHGLFGTLTPLLDENEESADEDHE